MVAATTPEQCDPPQELTGDEVDALVYARDLAVSVLSASPGYTVGKFDSDINAIRCAVEKAIARDSR